MNTSLCTAAKILCVVVGAHVIVLGSAAVALQKRADAAMMPIVKAQPIIIAANKSTTNLAVAAAKAASAKRAS